MSVSSSLKQQWESAEIHRSGIEAQLTDDARLVASERNTRRYLDPPLETPYPLEYAYALLGDVRGRTVLDFGCGSGENALLLARRGARVIGVDISESLISLAERRLRLNGMAGCAKFVVGSAHDLPIRSGSVAVVFGIAILHHLDLSATSREIYRVLEENGRAIFQEPVRDSRLVRAVRKCIPYRAPDISPFERPLISAELQQFSRPFASSRTRAFSLPFVNAAQAIPSLRRHLTAAYRYDHKLLTRLPSLKVFSGIRVLELVK
ncbi:MAG TPA: methyltransferase domain-containing protein [Vicinamibacterales bacterium]